MRAPSVTTSFHSANEGRAKALTWTPDTGNTPLRAVVAVGSGWWAMQYCCQAANARPPGLLWALVLPVFRLFYVQACPYSKTMQKSPELPGLLNKGSQNRAAQVPLWQAKQHQGTHTALPAQQPSPLMITHLCEQYGIYPNVPMSTQCT